MKPQILAENDRFRAVRLVPPQPCGVTVVQWPALRGRFSATENSDFPAILKHDFATKRGMISISVETRRNDWFQSEEIFEITRAIAASRPPGEAVISYGNSMGAHAAVSFGAEVGAQYFLSLGPQASLAKAFMQDIGDTRWPDSVEVFRFDRIREGLCKDLQGAVMVDPAFAQDLRHAEVIVENTQGRLFEIQGAWHGPGRLLNRVHRIGDLIQAVGLALRQSEPPENALAVARKALDASFEHRFITGSDAERAGLLEEFGAALMGRTLDFRSILQAFKAAPSLAFMSQVEGFADHAYKRQHLGVALLACGMEEQGIELLLADGEPKISFFSRPAQAFLLRSATRLGVDAWRSEAMRLERAGDIEGALFCLETARDTFSTGAFVEGKIAEYRSVLDRGQRGRAGTNAP